MVLVCKVHFSDGSKRFLAIRTFRGRKTYSVGNGYRNLPNKSWVTDGMEQIASKWGTDLHAHQLAQDIDTDAIGQALLEIDPEQSLEEFKEAFWAAIDMPKVPNSLIHLMHPMATKVIQG